MFFSCSLSLHLLHPSFLGATGLFSNLKIDIPGVEIIIDLPFGFPINNIISLFQGLKAWSPPLTSRGGKPIAQYLVEPVCQFSEPLLCRATTMLSYYALCHYVEPLALAE